MTHLQIWAAELIKRLEKQAREKELEKKKADEHEGFFSWFKDKKPEGQEVIS